MLTSEEITWHAFIIATKSIAVLETGVLGSDSPPLLNNVSIVAGFERSMVHKLNSYNYQRFEKITIFVSWIPWIMFVYFLKTNEIKLA